MTFSSILFCYVFLPFSIVLYYLIPKRYKNIFLFIISLMFYAIGDLKGLIVLLFVIFYNYFSVNKMDRLANKKRKYKLIEIIIINVFLLLYFKYYFSILNLLTSSNNFKTFLAPLGLSFYLFTILSYVFDVYKKEIKCEKKFINLGLFIAFFPKLLMGPINRYGKFKKQLHRVNFDEYLFNNGIKRFILGLSMKTILADTFARIIPSIVVKSTVGAFLLLLLYSLQIYFDFAGYTNMALGLSNIFGFKFEENFNYPYLSKTVSEFWNRWHITLGKWFKDYIYIPLGGNRKGKKRLILNILIVWILTGIWHGATINFVLWGLYFGMLILIEKLFLNRKKWPIWLNVPITYFLVSIGWLIFFNNDISFIKSTLGYLFNWHIFIDSSIKFVIRNNNIYIILGILCSIPLFKNIGNILRKKHFDIYQLLNVIYLTLLLFLSTAFMISNSYQSFLYFRF